MRLPVSRKRYEFVLQKLRTSNRKAMLLERDLIACETQRDELLGELRRALLALRAALPRHAPQPFLLGDDEGLKAWPTKGTH